MSRKTKIVLCIYCVLKLSLHLIADMHSGFQGDEFLHIATGRHLAFGYMEFPPLIAVIAFIQNLFQSDSIFIHHLFPHIASLLILIYVARITVALGGKTTAVFFALFAILIGPGFERSQQLFQPVVFSQLFWVISFYQLINYLKAPGEKRLWLLTIFCLLGFLMKYDILFFITGLLVLLFSKKQRMTLWKQKPWKQLLVFFLCISPNLAWQYMHHFPAVQMFSRLYQTQLDEISRLENLGKLFLSINPVVSVLMVLPGIFYLLKTNDPVKKTVGASIALSALALIIANGKFYYFYPFILTLIPFGAVLWEQVITLKRKWIFYPITILLLLGIMLIPFGMPVYSFQRYLAKVYPYEATKIKGGTAAIHFEEYYAKEKWAATMQALKQVYDSLPATEKAHCLIWGKHYGQAGAVNLWAGQYGLPQAFSYHGSFYSWAPDGAMPPVIIALSYQVGNYFQPFFEQVTLVKTLYNPYAYDEEQLYQKIYICKNPRQDFAKMKSLFQKRIFE